MRRPLALLFLLLAVMFGAADRARAAGTEVGIADDRVLLAGGPQADRAVAEWQRLGVDVVRIYALWSRIAPAPDSRSAPAGFDAADPDAAGYQWGSLDQAVARVRGAGMRVMLTITGPGPLWSSRVPSLENPRYKPDPARYADFSTAVARRYGREVDRYILWNEPNLPSWLQPQAACTKAGCTPVAPHIYRELVRAAYPAVHAADPGAQVLIGALASRGLILASMNATMRPMTFVRGLGCVSSRYAPVRTGACRDFRPASADGFAFHPHGGLTAPGTPFPNPDDVNLASLGRLTGALDRLQRAGALRSGAPRLDLFLDEYGYQTNPPDRIGGVSATAQDVWLQRAAYDGWRNPRVRMMGQYLWRDEPFGPRAYSGWQSGLRYADERAKPALAHFGMPFVLDAARGRLWGQVRPGSTHTVAVQRRLPGAASFRTIATLSTDARGYWSRSLRLTRRAVYRFSAAGATSAAVRR